MAETTYRHLEIQDAKAEPTLDELAEIEAILGVKLPKEFLEFLKVANGAYIPFGIDIDGEAISFCSIHKTGRNDQGEFGFGTFVGEIRVCRENVVQIPERVLPFAEDGGGSSVFLDLTDEGNERVVAFVHGTPDWAGGDNVDKFVEIAPSFGEYVERLYWCDEDYI